LLKEFIEPLGLSQKAVAAHIGIPVQRINEIIKGKRGVSPDTRKRDQVLQYHIGRSRNLTP